MSILASSGIMALNNFYVRSDRRTKKNIRPIDAEYANAFVKNVNPSYFHLKTDDADHHPRIGYIAQHFRDYIDLLCFTPNEEIVIEDEGDVEGIQLAVDYTRVGCLLHKALKDLIIRVEELETLIKRTQQER